MDLESLALAVDAMIFRPPSERGAAARLYGVVVGDDDSDLSPPVLRLLGKGDAKQMLKRVRIPAGLSALAVAVAGWRAPLEPDGSVCVAPSQHPQRQRIHSTCLVAGKGDLVNVLRTACGDPEGRIEVMSGGDGVFPDLMRSCWQRGIDRAAGRVAGDGLPWDTARSTG